VHRILSFSLLLVLLAGMAPAQMAQPGPEHKAIAQLAGSWTGQATLQFPGMEPMSSEVKVTNTMDLGGFWLLGDYEGSMMGIPFRGHSIFGFDTEKGKYVEIWVDSMRSGMGQLEGDYDAGSRRWTKWLDTKHPMTGEPIRERHTVTLRADDTMIMELALPGADGDYLPYMILEQTRVK
jgi:hypothetical protein